MSEPSQPAEIAVVIPLYNERENADTLIDRLQNLALSSPIRWELIFVDDGSTDGTTDSLVRAIRERGGTLRCRVIELSRNFGKEAALAVGFAAAASEFVATVDGDLQDPPELLPQMLETLWKTGADVVCGKRMARDGETLVRRVGAYVYYRIARFVSDVTPDVDVGDFRLMRRQVVEGLGRFPERSRFMKAIYAAAGFRRVVFPYDRQPRAGGRPKLSIVPLVDLAIDGITSLSIKPLRISTYLGLIVFVLSFGYGGFVLFRLVSRGDELSPYAGLMVLILMMNGLLFLLLGLLGEYVGRTLIEVKQRPIAIVRRDLRLPADTVAKRS